MPTPPVTTAIAPEMNTPAKCLIPLERLRRTLPIVSPESLKVLDTSPKDSKTSYISPAMNNGAAKLGAKLLKAPPADIAAMFKLLPN